MPAGSVGAADAAPARHVTTIMYDFESLEEGRAWYEHFVSGADDGFGETAGAPGCLACVLYRHADSETPTKYGFYEEWDRAESQTAYTKQRSATGFLARWLGLDLSLSPPRMTKLREEGGISVQQGTLVASSVRGGASAPGVGERLCRTVGLYFCEAADRDAFLEWYMTSEDGYKAACEADGCLVQKIYTQSATAAGWAPPSDHAPGFAGFYSEWESRAQLDAYTAARRGGSIGGTFMGMDAEGVCHKLQGGKPRIDDFILAQTSGV